MLVYYSNYGSISSTYNLQYTNPIYALSIKEQVIVKYSITTAYSTESYTEPSTIYLYIAGSHDLRRHRKGDINSLGTLPTWSALLTGIMWSRTMKPIKPLETHLLVGGDYTFH